MTANSLEGRVVAIAGAAGGLGSVATAAFAAAGARLALLGRSLDKLDELAEELKLPNDHFINQAADLSDAKKDADIADAVVKKFGKIEVLLNFVGGWIGGKPVLETKKEDFDSMLDQHFYSPFALVQAFLPSMLKNKWGRILAISSPNASRPPGKNSPYAVGKSAMEALMLSLARELHGSGVTANLVLVRTIDVKHERENAPSAENRSWTTPEEISATLLYLCSLEAGVINGARIPLFAEPF
ncbi:MAG TPA: SDR family oxidoreductase [Terriglobales bacterium]|nr:SDR family oxidoreductase [Terriglobales bacterium]